jgi:hypothetical protein
MNLRYIALYMDYDAGFKDPFRDNFNLKSRFISNFLSVQIRKLKIQTDGTFKMIGVSPSIDPKHICRIVGEKSLQARTGFDKVKYEQLTELERYGYYLQLLEEGYRICAQHKDIPLKQLLNLHQQFRDNNYKNEWLQKRRVFKSVGIEATLSCHFTSFDFQLILTVIDLKSKKELVSGMVIRTLPDEVCFSPLFKDIKIDGKELIITEYADRPKFKFQLTDVFNGVFSYQVTDFGLKYVPFV